MAASAGPSTANRSPAETAAAAGLASAGGVSGAGGASLLGAAGSGDLGECSFRPYESTVYFAASTGHAAQRHMFSLHLSITIQECRFSLICSWCTRLASCESSLSCTDHRCKAVLWPAVTIVLTLSCDCSYNPCCVHVCVAAGLSTAVLLSQLAHAAAPAAPLPSTTDALHPWSLLQHWQAAATAYGLQGLQGSAAGRGVQDPYFNSALTLTLAAAALSGASQG